jgi:diguanylate cyclase (GGDEF)-like protein
MHPVLPSETPRPHAPDLAVERAEELVDTVQRARLGGAFYVFGWLLAGYAEGLSARHPLVYGLLALLFAAFVLLRHRLSMEATTPSHCEQRIRRAWGVVLLGTCSWGLAVAWLLWVSQQEAGRSVLLFATVAFVAAMAHSFAMREGAARLGLLLLALPSLIVLLLQPELRLLGGALVVFLVYAFAVLRRSHREYWLRVRLGIELARQRDQFESQSRRDVLTGLANRRRMESALANLLASARLRGQPFALLLIDCDHFKDINDRNGHAAGDAALRALAARLESQFAGAGEIAARWGGEEFLVLLPGCDIGAAANRAEALRQSLESAPLDSGDGLPLRVSIGVAASRVEAGLDVDALLRDVDAALYAAKRRGRNRVELAVVSGVA